MTVVRRDVLDAVATGARGFLLTASRTALEERIARNNEAQEWRKNNLDRCPSAFADGDLGEPVATEDLEPIEVARLIIRRL